MLQKKLINLFHGMLQLAPGAQIMQKLRCSVCGSGKSEPDGGAAFSGAVLVGFTLVRGGAGDGLPGTLQAL